MKTLIRIATVVSLASVILTLNLYGDECGTDNDCSQVDNLQCVENQCSCVSGFTRNGRRGCSGAYGAECAHVLDCNIDLFFKCNHTTNACDCQQPDRQVYDATRERCVSRIGFDCSHETTGDFSLYCVEGAYCDMPIVNGSMTHECKCTEGWRITKDRACRQLQPSLLRP